MDKKKVAINIRLNMFAEMNQKDIDRLLDKPFNLKQKDFEFTAKKTVEVVDPDWTPKIFQQNLYYSVRREMQVLAVRAFEALKAYDSEKNPFKQAALGPKLKKKLNKSAQRISGQAQINLKKITDAANKSATKWDKAKVAKIGGEMKDIAKSEKDLEGMVAKLEGKLRAGFQNMISIEKKAKAEHDKALQIQKKKLQNLKSAKSDGSVDDKDQIQEEAEDAREKMEKIQIKSRKDYSKNSEQNFIAYRSDRKSFHEMLKDTIKMTKQSESKDKQDKKDKNIKNLNKIFKNMSKSAKEYGAYLKDLDDYIAYFIKKVEKDRTGERWAEQDIINMMPEPAMGNEFYSYVRAAQNQLKKIKS